MNMNLHARTSDILRTHPECCEFLYPFHQHFSKSETLESLAGNAGLSGSSLVKGLERCVKRAVQNPCNFEKMRSRLIVPGSVNVAGFVHFLWQESLVHELKARAKALKINLNINLFPKHLKKEFQNYLSLCNTADDLPEILIGKGFSSLSATRFYDQFLRTGHYRHELPFESMSDSFYNAGFSDREHIFHPFGIEEMVMVFDKTVQQSVAMPGSWDDLLTPEYKDMVCQMGKDRNDHFGFVVLLYFFSLYGMPGVVKYAANVKVRQHFSQTVSDIGKNHPSCAPVNILHQFAADLIRSNAREVTERITPKEGNPGICHYFMLKNTAGPQELEIAAHLYAPSVRSIVEKSGVHHITSTPSSGNSKIRWIGWETLKTLPMPYMKEYLAEIAYEHYKN